MERKKYVIVDLDGTVAEVHPERLAHILSKPKNFTAYYSSNWNDKPIIPIVNLVNVLSYHYDIVFCTGRSEQVRAQTLKWIDIHLPQLSHARLLMRPDNDRRKDWMIKPGMLWQAGITTEDVAFVLDDRKKVVKTWRDAGFTCLAVVEGDY